jgi:chaperonin GroES
LVIAVGPGKYYQGNVLVPNECKVGDTVLFSAQAGADIRFEGEDLIVLKEEEIMAIIG